MCDYQFYLERSDGVSSTADYQQLRSEPAAVNHARRLLTQHSSAVRVRVWRNDKQVLVVGRAANDPDPRYA